MCVSRGIACCLAIIITVIVYGQELNCQVEINAEQVEVSSRQRVEALRTAVSDYMNTTSFTDVKFMQREKIDCRMFFAVKSCNNESYTVDLQVQSSRPVYNSAYTTQLINFKENDLSFIYRQGEPLTYSTMAIESQLTAILDFYAYLILAMDFDSFSKRGGDECFRQIERIVQMGQSTGEKGWRQYDSPTSRGAVLAALTNPATSSLRDLNYSYHRDGLDIMSENAGQGRAAITERMMTVLKEVYDANPMSVGLTMWRDAKLNEIVGIYSHESASDKKKIADMLKDIYPSDTEVINRIVNK